MPAFARCRAAALLLVMVWLSWFAPPAGAAPATPEKLVLDAAQVWDFAESLLRDGEYYRAISEYRRLIHFFPDSERVPVARLRIGEALLQGGEPARAIAYLDALEPEPALAAQRNDLLYLRGLAKLELERGRPYPLREPSITAGLADLHAIGPTWPGRPRVQGFLDAMHDPPELPEKSPALAGTLSAIFPGTGSFYVGRPAEGSLALFVNVVLIYATVNAFEQDKQGLGLVLGGFAVAFYGGSILAAVNGAHKFNDRTRAAYLAQQRTRFGIVVERGALGAAFRKDF